MFFSASDLCKRTACQIAYLRSHPDKIFVTPEQLVGIKKQANATLSEYIEMRGQYRGGSHLINFSWDEVRVSNSKKATFIEHKQVLGECEDWYFNNSLVQTAVYAALTESVKELETATFYVKSGNPKLKLSLHRVGIKRFILQFGRSKYRINITNPTKIRAFILAKAIASTSWDGAKAWDKKYKHGEFSFLQDCFTFNKVL